MTDWRYSEAIAWLDGQREWLAGLGFDAELVGSLASGASHAKDLDVVLTPSASAPPRSLEEALGVLEASVYPQLSGECAAMPVLEAAHRPECWFVPVHLADARVVEFYLEERHFPLAMSDSEAADPLGGVVASGVPGPR